MVLSPFGLNYWHLIIFRSLNFSSNLRIKSCFFAISYLSRPQVSAAHFHSLISSALFRFLLLLSQTFLKIWMLMENPRTWLFFMLPAQPSLPSLIIKNKRRQHLFLSAVLDIIGDAGKQEKNFFDYLKKEFWIDCFIHRIGIWYAYFQIVNL